MRPITCENRSNQSPSILGGIKKRRKILFGLSELAFLRRNRSKIDSGERLSLMQLSLELNKPE